MGPYIYVVDRRLVRAESRWRNARRLLLFVAVPLLGMAVLSPRVASADQVGGIPTTGCFGAVGYSHLLWSGSAVRVANVSISYRLTLVQTPGASRTVVQAGWQLSPQGADWETAYWSSNNAMASTTFFVGEANTPSTLVHLEPGTTGTLAYRMTLRGYGPGACFQVSDVRVLINRTTSSGGGAETAAPGGGGFASPTPTAPGATPTPTVPPNPTFIPGATPGPGVECFHDWAGVLRCYPPAPDGYCYVSSPLGNTGSGQLVRCSGATAPPVADLTTCAGLIATYGYEFCFSGTQGGQFGNTGTIGTVTDWDGQAENVAVGGWVTVVHSGAGAASAWSMNANGDCTFTGAGWTTERYNVNNSTGSGAIGTYHVNLSGSVGVRNPLTTQNWTVSGAASRNWGSPCTNTSVDRSVPMKINKSGGTGSISWSWVIFFDMGGTVGATPPPPTPSPTPTLPPNYCGQAGCPTFNVDVDVNVDICEDDPNIIACQYSFPPMTVDLCATDPTIAACATPRSLPTDGVPGPESTWWSGQIDGLSSGLRAKAPFGYIDQVGTALVDAAADAEGAPLDLSFPMPVFAPAEAGGSHDIEVEIPLDDMVAPLVPFRGLLLALLVIGIGIRLLKIALATVGASGGASKDGDE